VKISDKADTAAALREAERDRLRAQVTSERLHQLTQAVIDSDPFQIMPLTRQLLVERETDSGD